MPPKLLPSTAPKAPLVATGTHVGRQSAKDNLRSSTTAFEPFPSAASEPLPTTENDFDFVLVGTEAISKYLNEPLRSVLHLIRIGALPVFKLPHSFHWRLRPARLRAIYQELEDQAMAKAAERRALLESQEAPPARPQSRSMAPAKPKRPPPRRTPRQRSARPAK
jgi:hypothetical protein